MQNTRGKPNAILPDFNNMNNDRLKSKVARKHVKRSHNLEFLRHNRLLPREYVCKFDNIAQEKHLARYKSIELTSKMYIDGKKLNKVPPSLLRRCQGTEIDVFSILHPVGNNLGTIRVIKLMKYLKEAYFNVYSNLDEISPKIVQAILLYLPLATDKFRFAFDSLYTKPRYFPSKQTNVYAVAENTKYFLRYIPSFKGMKLTQLSCLSLSNIISLSVKNVGKDLDGKFWDNLSKLKTLCYFSLEIDDDGKYFDSFEKIVQVVLNMNQLRSFSVILEKNSNWESLLKNLQALSDLPERRSLKLNVEINLPSPNFEEPDNSIVIKRKQADQKICEFFPIPREEGINVDYKIWGGSDFEKEFVYFAFRIQNGKFVASSIKSETSEYFQFHRKVFELENKVSELSYFEQYTTPQTESEFSFLKDFEEKAENVSKLKRLDLYIENSNIIDCELPLRSFKYFEELESLRISIVIPKNDYFDDDDWVETVGDKSKSITDILPVIQGKDCLREFELSFPGHVYNIEGFYEFFNKVFTLPQLSKFSVQTDYLNLEKGEKEALLNCMGCKIPISVSNVSFDLIFSNDTRGLEERIKTLRQILESENPLLQSEMLAQEGEFGEGELLEGSFSLSFVKTDGISNLPKRYY